MKRTLLFLLLLSSIAGAATAAGETRWIHLNNRDEVRTIFRRGNLLWLGTNGGLLLYDLENNGIAQEYILGENLPSSSIRAVASRDETVYIGTDAGLTMYEDGGFRLYRPPGNDTLEQIRSIDFGPEGDICIGTYGHGAGVIHQGELTMVTRVDSLLDDRVYAVIQMDDSTYYYATSYGVCAFKDSLWWNYRVGAGLPKGEALDLVVTVDYAMYALIAGAGIFFFDGSRGRRFSPRDLFLDDEIAAIALQEDQTLWAAGVFGRIQKCRSVHWEDAAKGDQEIARARWLSAYAHPGGGVYFGSAGGLVAAIEDGDVRKWNIPSSLPSNNIRAMVEDSTGRRYIAAAGDLISIAPEGESVRKEPLDGPVTAMAVSPGGELYCGTRWGLFRGISGRFEEIPIEHVGRAAVLTALCLDREGRLWLGTDEGEVLRYDGSLWLCLGERDELTGGQVDAIVQDGSGSIWALSPQTGVASFDGHHWKKFPLDLFGGRELAAIVIGEDGRPLVAGAVSLWRYAGGGTWSRLEIPELPVDISLTALCLDEAGRLYAGTSEGLLLIDGKSSSYIDPRTGLAGKNVSSLLLDHGGWLWVGFYGDGISYAEADALW